jgi:AbrB family looped-hinge helix DNA binding protein
MFGGAPFLPSNLFRVAHTERFKVSTSGQLSLPAAVRRRWHLSEGGQVDVIDLGFGVLTVPVGSTGRLFDQVLPAEVHYSNVVNEEDPDLRTT